MPPDQNLLFLVNTSCSGVYFFINLAEKAVWISYSKNMAESITRNIRLIKLGDHPIKDLTLYVIGFDGENKEDLTRVYLEFIKDGFTVLSRPIKYSIRSFISTDFRKQEGYLNYVWLYGQKRPVRLLGVFENVRDGEAFKVRLELNGGQINASNTLLNIEQKKLLEEALLMKKNKGFKEFISA